MKSFITKNQIKSTAEYMYSASKLVLGGGIITPLLNKETSDTTIAYVIAAALFAFGLFLEGISDRMGSDFPNN